MHEMSRKKIGELLIDAGLITRAQLEEALDLQSQRKAKVVDILIGLGYLDQRTFVRFLAQQPGVASINLSNYMVPANLASLVPREFAVKHEVFPIDKLGKLLTLGMACPLDVKTIQKIEEITSLKVKPLLCAPNDVREAIRRYYPDPGLDKEDAELSMREKTAREAPLKIEGVAYLIRQVSSLPALPDTVNRAREAMTNPMSSVSEVGNIIAMDPAIAAKVLSVANSAAYGFPNRVDNVTLAVTLLGLRETYSIVLSAAVINFFEKSRRFDYKSFWLDAMCCAAASRIVAKVCKRASLSGVFTAGLLHDIGRAALSHVAGDRYAQVPANARGADLIAAEELVFGLAHPEAGFELACHWGLPMAIAEPIRFHHNPERASAENKDMVAITALAQAMSYTRPGEEQDAASWPFNGLDHALSALGLHRETAEAMIAEFRAKRDSSLMETP